MPSFTRILSILLVAFVFLSSIVLSSPLQQLDPKLRAVIESDPELMAQLEDMIKAGTFPAAYDNGRLFNYQRLG